MNGEVSEKGSARPFRIGPWLVRPDLNRIVGEDETRQVEPRVMQVLVCLAERAGRVVERDELFREVWGETVVSDESLTRTIWEIRNLFGDNPRDPKIVETIRKGGYRMIAPVTFPNTEAECVTDVPDTSPTRFPGARVVWIAAVAVLLFGTLTVWQWIKSGGSTGSGIVLGEIPFTTFLGVESDPAFSPDGSRIAFSWEGGTGASRDIYIKQINTEVPLRLTDDPADEGSPVWSPDGNTIAFVRFGEEKGIFTVPAIGGPVRRLIHADGAVRNIDWSPDGTSLVYTSWVDDELAPQITILTIETLETRAITQPPPRYSCDYRPRFSPDGQSVAFIRSGPVFIQDIYTVSVTGENENRLTSSRDGIEGFDWMPGGHSIVFSSTSTVDCNLWSISTDGGNLCQLPVRGRVSINPSVAPNGGRLVYENHSRGHNIWRARIPEEGADDVRVTPELFISSTRLDSDARYSPDGEKILFLSDRSGEMDVWVCDRDGMNPRRFTDLQGRYVRGPRWSPDGERVAFTSLNGEHPVIGYTGREGGRVRYFSPSGEGETMYNIMNLWSADGESIYFEQGDGVGWRVCRMNADGTGVVSLIDCAAEVLYEGEDGALYYFNMDKGGIWRHPTDGMEEEPLVDPDQMVYWGGVEVMEEGVYFIQGGPDATYLGFFDFLSKETRLAATISGGGAAGFSMSPDGKYIILGLPEKDESDLVLVDFGS